MVIHWTRLLLAIVLTIAAVSFFGMAVWRRIGYIRLGTPAVFEHKSQGRKPRTGFTAEVLGHRRLLNDIKSGLMHVFYFYGFIVLQFGAIDLIWKRLNNGQVLPFFDFKLFTFIQEITVLLILAALIYGGYRRYGERLERLKRGWKPSIVLWFIGSLMLTVLATLAFERLVYSGPHPSGWHAPISGLLETVLLGVGIKAGSIAAAAGLELFWWLHLLILLSFLVYVPQSKHFHLLTAPVNIWFRRGEQAVKLAPLDLEDEEAETFGVGSIEQFNQKQLLDLYACVECGRCTNVCPASNTGKLLSPMHLITKLRDHLTEKGAAITSKSPWMPMGLVHKQVSGAHRMGAAIPLWEGLDLSKIKAAEESAQLPAASSDIAIGIADTMLFQEESWQISQAAKAEELSLIGDVITEEELWSCTTCRNCEEQCPVGNEHVDKIIDMRRSLVLMEGKLPSDGQRALSNIERQSNPWGLPRADRAAWMEECEKQTGIRVRTMKELSIIGEQPDVVIWAGSMGAYDARSRKVLFDLVRLLEQAGLSFGTLGGEERSSGDTARRMGNELLFQELCKENIATIQKYNMKHIVTACPHTYHTFKHEYPDFGLTGDIVIEHHSELLASLIEQGRIAPQHDVNETITIHDSCYMGRYNDSYEAPRQIARSIPGMQLKEMKRSGSNAMCCGAGGGMMWMEENAGTRINYARTKQALEVSPTVISSACPYCLTMMEDGIKSLKDDGSVAARDIAELLALSVFGKRIE
ncbi:(Fe-S)-binding protein [Paenibacillus sp. IITD108]|uniref:(Fe-S)-binding protein n=1 Tax=Paenibacillus sp. IITD108 TaxID=3116649 RepID=UPI002F3FCAEF